MTQHSLPELPYAKDALEPHISAETIEYHYGKHHASYVAKLNELVAGTQFEGLSLEELVHQADGVMFNNAAQIWNHSFYWQCLSPQGGGEPDGALGSAMREFFGSFTDFQQAFTAAATSNFGSGWTWLVTNPEGKLEIVNTDDAANPMTAGHRPLLTCDVWEHAYYIDYRNSRPAYLEAFWKLVNWEFVSQNHGG